MISIDKNLKPLLNILIRYYRSTSTQEEFQVKNFIIDKYGEKICDKSTFSKLENNKILCGDEIYFRFLKKLKLSFEIYPSLNKTLHNLNKKLVLWMEINDTKKIIYYLKKAISILEDFQNYIFYKEAREVYILLLLYYEKQEFNKSLLDKYISLYELIFEELCPIFISIAYHYYSRVNIDEFLSIDLLTKSLSMKSKSIIKEFLICAYYVRSNQNLKIVSQANKGILLCSKTNNSFYIVKFYNLLAYAYRFSDPSKALYYMSLCIEHFDEKYDSYETLKIHYHNMAYLAYDCKDYTSILHVYHLLYNDIHFLETFFYILIDAIQNTSKDIHEIQRILSIVLSHKEEHHAFHQTILTLYESIYIHISFRNFTNNLNKLITFKDYFKNEALLKEVIIQEVRNYCIKNKRNVIFHEFMKNFQ